MTRPETNDPGCVFCHTPAPEILLSDGIWYATLDRHPVTPGHLLVLPFRHCTDLPDINPEEMAKLLPFIRECREFTDARFHPQGYNIGTNIGAVAGQCEQHFHIHIIPRYTGDTPDPRGGIRAVVPENALRPYTDRIASITGITNSLCIEESFADLTEIGAMDALLRTDATDALLVTDLQDAPLALALKTTAGWRIASAVLNGGTDRVNERFIETGGRTCQTSRADWMKALKEYYSRRIISTIPPVSEMNQAGRAGHLTEMLEITLQKKAGASCLDCCCGPGTGSEVIRSLGMTPISYDNLASQLALGFLRGRLKEEETCCIDATIASRYLDPVEFGLGLMLGDISSSNAGIWERIAAELLTLSAITVFTVVTEKEAQRVARWCRDAGRDTEVFENQRHPIFDRWVCTAFPRR